MLLVPDLTGTSARASLLLETFVSLLKGVKLAKTHCKDEETIPTLFT